MCKCYMNTMKLLQVPSQLEESDLLLNLPPDRIGHGTFLHPEVGGSQSVVDKVLKNNIPLGKTRVKPLTLCEQCLDLISSSVLFFSFRALSNIECQRTNCAKLLQTSLQILVPVGTPKCDLCKFSLCSFPFWCNKSFSQEMFDLSLYWKHKSRNYSFRCMGGLPFVHIG